MASIREIVTAQFAPATQAAMYTSPAGIVTRIDKLTVTNGGGSSATITLNLVPSGGTPGQSNETTATQAVLPGATFNSPNEYGHYLNPGDALWATASTASALSIAVAGTQVSA